ncbi:MAG: GH92 family glycosyl hydrolase [Verrucomicrobia bacterium]|nr:GH92 family glycosyl hydrolase [Verrucomicrobiota bacterium]
MPTRQLLWLIPFLLAVGSGSAAPASLVHLANPMQGTDSTHDFSHGNTYPAIASPFPMNAWSAYTQPVKDSFFYQYRQTKLRGIRQTHQPSPWIGDYAAFSLMPVFGKLAVNEQDRASDFRHETEVVNPSYYSVRLDTWKTKAEVTPTERAARFRFTFEEAGDAYVALDAFPGGSSVEIIPAERKIVGTCRNNHGGVPDNFSNYFVVVFDQPITAQGVWTPDSVKEGQTSLQGDHVGAYVKFDVAAGGVVGCKVASSFISPAQALRNLETEIGGADFDTVRARAEASWNEAFSRIQIEGGSAEQQRTFYTAFYRAILFPHKFYEINEQGKPCYYSPYDGKVHEGKMFTDSGYWDTFRAVHPFFNLLFPEMSADMLPAMLHAYEQSGWLPAWASPGHRSCMIGNHSFSLLADGWAKSIRTFDLNQAVDAMVHDANTPGPERCRSIGRDGVAYYNKIGYVPWSNVRGEPSVAEGTAKTLEYAYNDWCAAALARAAGREADAATFAKRAMNYANVFDAQTGFVRGRKADGAWTEPFYPDEWGGPFTEGSSWHWIWSVFHDVSGLVKLMGGDEVFGAKLDGVFYSPNTARPGTYGRPIHEMTEMIALNMGQYAHGNQPIQHAIYLYDYVGQPWKAQSRLRQVMSLLYQPTPDGLCGDEDNGQTSAWYVFSALGFYPMCPGDTTYAIGSPLFDRATLKLPGGKTFTVVAEENGPQRVYIRGAKLNGAAYDKVYLRHEDIVNGGEVVFRMTSAPDYKWGSSPEARPPSVLLPPAGK